jgi:hypothetical protein
MNKIVLNLLDLFLNRFEVAVSSFGFYALGIVTESPQWSDNGTRT